MPHPYLSAMLNNLNFRGEAHKQNLLVLEKISGKYFPEGSNILYSLLLAQKRT
jgi:hypothetical protein